MLLENDLFPQDVRVRDEADSLVAAGYDVHVIAPRGPGQRRGEELAGVTVERYWLPMAEGGGSGGLLVEYAVAHAQLLLRGLRALLGGTHFLHAHNPPDTLFPLALVARRVRRRFIFDEHDLFPSLFEQRFGRGPLWRVAAFANRTMIRNADVVLVTNRTHLEEARRTPPRLATRLALVRNGPRESSLTAARAALRPGRLADPRLLYVGALEPQDGVRLLPELLERLIADHDLADARLTIAGWGSELEPLRSDFRARGLLDRVRLLGRTPHDEVLRLIAGADICLDPAPCTPFNHGTTMVKISEYLAFGRPTVAYGLRETIETAAGAVSLVACDNEGAFVRRVAELAESEEARADLERRALARAPALVWERQAARMVEAYDAVARGDGAQLRR
jgi:glycosyltransferase involved in cell wall biosynthesis